MTILHDRLVGTKIGFDREKIYRIVHTYVVARCRTWGMSSKGARVWLEFRVFIRRLPSSSARSSSAGFRRPRSTTSSKSGLPRSSISATAMRRASAAARQEPVSPHAVLSGGSTARPHVVASFAYSRHVIRALSLFALAGCGACGDENRTRDAALACIAARLAGQATYYAADGTGNCSFPADADAHGRCDQRTPLRRPLHGAVPASEVTGTPSARSSFAFVEQVSGLLRTAISI